MVAQLSGPSPASSPEASPFSSPTQKPSPSLSCPRLLIPEPRLPGVTPMLPVNTVNIPLSLVNQLFQEAFRKGPIDFSLKVTLACLPKCSILQGSDGYHPVQSLSGVPSPLPLNSGHCPGPPVRQPACRALPSWPDRKLGKGPSPLSQLPVPGGTSHSTLRCSPSFRHPNSLLSQPSQSRWRGERTGRRGSHRPPDRLGEVATGRHPAGPLGPLMRVLTQHEDPAPQSGPASEARTHPLWRAQLSRFSNPQGPGPWRRHGGARNEALFVLTPGEPCGRS